MHAAVIHDRLSCDGHCVVCAPHSTDHDTSHALMLWVSMWTTYTETSLAVHNALCHWADSIAVYVATVHRCYVIINATVQWCASGVLCVTMISVDVYRGVMTLMLRWRWRWMKEADEWVVAKWWTWTMCPYDDWASGQERKKHGAWESSITQDCDEKTDESLTQHPFSSAGPSLVCVWDTEYVYTLFCILYERDHRWVTRDELS